MPEQRPETLHGAAGESCKLALELDLLETRNFTVAHMSELRMLAPSQRSCSCMSAVTMQEAHAHMLVDAAPAASKAADEVAEIKDMCDLCLLVMCMPLLRLLDCFC